MFPKFYQPDPSVGAVLVHSQDEMDALVVAGWPSKSMNQPPAKDEKTEALLARIAALEAQIAATPASVSAAPSSVSAVPSSVSSDPVATSPAPAPVTASPAPASKK